MNIDAMASEARRRLHMMIEKMAKHAGDERAFRAVVKAHRHALAGGSFNRSLAQRLRRLQERSRRSASGSQNG